MIWSSALSLVLDRFDLRDARRRYGAS